MLQCFWYSIPTEGPEQKSHALLKGPGLPLSNGQNNRTTVVHDSFREAIYSSALFIVWFVIMELNLVVSP